MDLFCSAIGMEINMGKSSIRSNALGVEAQDQLKNILPFALSDIDDGIKYLGFELKPNSYGYVDWLWLFKKIQARIDLWVNHFLSSGGHLGPYKVQFCVTFWFIGIPLKNSQRYFDKDSQSLFSILVVRKKYG
jgi:hypothetical protein